MGRRRGYYSGVYSKDWMSVAPPSHSNHTPDVQELTRVATTYFWTAYSSISGSHVAIMTVCLIVLLSFILPDISQKIHRTKELKAMKKAIDLMMKQVSRAEVACLTAADQFNSLQCSMQDGSTDTSRDYQDLAISTAASITKTQSAPVQVEKRLGFLRRIFFPAKNMSNKGDERNLTSEVTIMSYVYTDSFGDVNKTNFTE